MKNKKRGVSPVVATVLLIAMVIVLASIIFIWFRGFTKEAITKFDGQNVELLCEEVSFSASYSEESIYISNDGNIPIFGMQAELSGEGESSQIKLENGWPEKGLNSGKVASVIINIEEGINKIKLIPVLLGTTTERQTKTYVCDQKKYGKEVSF